MSQPQSLEGPHPDRESLQVRCAVITVSDTRNFETDRSGQLIRDRLTWAGHSIVTYQILKDEPALIAETVLQLCQRPDIDALLLNGGTGIAPRDTTYDAIARLLDKTLPGFGELLRQLSFAEVGSRAMASRAIAGVCQGKLVFSMPGSSNAVSLALDSLILPELIHLVTQLQK
ncbi:molybdenum cofactor biosynthesis protein B [Limnothrix sp. PR1529]|uniref:MogA/MoaB family molybdenum cofactor biosynthesis protein n=1 Tax=Limnothrix sp. PR1529 TaxID=1704291 RepID=UPI00081DDFDE|nr:MogA/MoaB family molybdenum cofactor biosynthesis protein [Limnothrix sp. PR1529]OCQ96477.1 molybdenum cofactor biosynthesis protein [Limnothrix sp. P13C2]PIB14922.1 molybdenum cofactor biosynthesis protein B [Limnothrix sp. PR1529]